MKRKIIIFCITIFLLLTCSYSVFAEEFDSSKTGSISVTLIEREQNEPIVGAELSVYYIATVVMDAERNLIYDYTKDFKNLDTALDDTSLPAKLDAFVLQHRVPSTKMTTDGDGTALCDKLSLGLYFIKQTGMVEGFAPCTSFLVTVPIEKNGEYVYEVNASPKTEVARLTSITIKKVWNTDASAAATERVTVQLLKNGMVIKTAILNSKNNWQVTYTGMPEGDDYSIKEVNVPKGFTVTYSRAGYVFTATNTPTLIQTGQLIWPIPVLAVCGMLLIAVGVVFLKKKEENNA